MIRDRRRPLRPRLLANVSELDDSGLLVIRNRTAGRIGARSNRAGPAYTVQEPLKTAASSLTQLLSRAAWLKRLDPVDCPEDDWRDSNPELLRAVRFDARPSDIKRGDCIVYQDPRSSRLFGLGTAQHDGNEALHDKSRRTVRWLFVVRVKLVMATRRLSDAPRPEELGIFSPGQYSYRALTKHERLLLAEAFRTSGQRFLIEHDAA
jgi:hypothetical protein